MYSHGARASNGCALVFQQSASSIDIHFGIHLDAAGDPRRLSPTVHPRMRIAIVTFDGFNELDSFIALGLLNRLGDLGWRAEIASPSTHVTSISGVTVQAQQPLEFANEADAVIFGSGIYTRAIAQDFGACSLTCRPAPI